jgi:DNA-binding CsgD family transcriptional regulator
MRTGRAEWVRWSDLLTRRQLTRMSLYPNRDGGSIGVALNRDVKDFSDRERLLLNVLRPHIRHAYEQAEALTLLRDQLAALNRGVEATGLGLLALSPDGRIAFVSEAARRWLQSYFAWDPTSLEPPPAIADWMQTQKVDYSLPSEIPAPPRPLVVGRGERTLSVRRTRNSVHEVLLLREVVRGVHTGPLKARGLSDREAEVLGWVSEGKTNPEIATILGLSPRTVHHHLEKIYWKLGVETRTAAAKMAREISEAVAPEHV